ncbi:MAG TPA: SRPBCC family protein [Chitinophagaceae bacterium]
MTQANVISPAMTGTEDREIVLTRLLDAPRELVFEAWTNPEHLVHWWGPNGFTITIKEMNVKPGGVWRFIMHGPDGVDYPNKVVYTEVVKPERLMYSQGWDIENGPKPFEDFDVTITFEKEGNKTRLTLKTVLASAEVLKKVVEQYGAIEGGKQTLNRLEAYLPNM